MNKARRAEIDRARVMIGEAKSIIEDVQSEEQEYYDNMPENLQSGEKGEAASAAADALQDAVDNLDGAIENLDTALE